MLVPEAIILVVGLGTLFYRVITTRTTVWIERNDIEALKEQFPGPKGGVDWTSVIKAALTTSPASDDGELERLRRKIRALERYAVETARRHKEVLDDWRQLADQKDAALAKAEVMLSKQNPLVPRQNFTVVGTKNGKFLTSTTIKSGLE